MRKTLFIIGLVSILQSCGSSKNTTVVAHQTATKPTSHATTPSSTPKPTVQRDHNLDFFRENIGDITKNDNTISYGSIVSAQPKGYEVVKTYFPSVGQNFRQRYIILHYTALDHEKSIRVLTTQSVSAHYLVNDLNDKEIYQLVDENKRAYHSGISSWRKDINLNDNSIGIEIINLGFTNVGGERIFAEYPDYQVRKVAQLVKDIANRYNIPATHILGHSDIAPTRKQDPGPKFPWKKLYTDYGIGMWYDDSVKNAFWQELQSQDFEAMKATPQFIYQLQSELKKFGYSLETSGEYDKPTQLVVQAFQYHFRPQISDGILDSETYAILKALIQKYP
ncbi:N-acetylmuramoyl-L-alanine amidase [Elizabethkingia sp. JS20170427COW]|uniref:N-acetylmuramoyl-L-alanine amidase n=1 Tax=Elizabethkingia sp. JS20170427COW TaxID=2583851 RepID=UPI001110BB2D|nr:N-acetylmuramoyl-L-alanine amidase [Elizabethkingia sp. JS20170427COW]QCX53660.1 N-acetylmuramoyl-L-alanine amidase [Elizabethkingia sp. JS20170427COW]